ncbi:recombinase family protein [Rubinisphaera brasiliensis]|uniref:Resolvase domain protein n=1 Tax=Rubinisphaera brasiliensis (strain ATCC 49424 / DSM 5305 / JCM 21570 / IAM 15109 / NBRC 103401 / IFAM 1448) TaxID=756272 RepID=F0SHC1_RUBBR|nr:recombinase family protein [Rubinisphaera brasiliensis]ADY61676.1 Resolvase domain protein [Rubinisphaera brasiliensis DSM 5305]
MAKTDQNDLAFEDLSRKVHAWWLDAAVGTDLDTKSFNENETYNERRNWALQAGLSIGTVYTRYSSKMQHSIEDQIRECVIWAARNRIYIPPELICADRAVSGKKLRRPGLENVKAILRERTASVLLVFKVSRLFRHAYEGFKLFQEEVVEEGLRAVSVSQGIDTAEEKAWKLQLQVHGICDEMLLEAIADHVRARLKILHENGYVTGAIGVGYRRKELPDAPRTNRGLPRAIPEIDPDAAKLICEHAKLLLNGMPISQGWMKWVQAGGPYDPRSTTGRMTVRAYRRLWNNIRLTGRWEFGRRRNRFASKRGYTEQIEQPDEQVETFLCEELRILDDETFLALQKMLAKNKQGPRGPRKCKIPKLWDLTTELFFCAECSTDDEPVRFYQTGAKGAGMQCKKGELCPCKSAVRRKDAILAICEKLAELIQNDHDLVKQVLEESLSLNESSDSETDSAIASAESRKKKLTQQINGLYELLGEGPLEDQKETKSRLRMALEQRSQTSIEIDRLCKQRDEPDTPLTASTIQQIFQEMSQLLRTAAAGELGEDAVFEAFAIFKTLTGGKILVHVERRKGRSRTNVKGMFRPCLIRAVEKMAGRPASDRTNSNAVEVWLRKPPRVDLLAEPTHRLIDIEGLSLREAAKRLRELGHNVNSGNLWYSYRRFYEMQGLEPPTLPYNNGKPRRSR